MKRHYVALAHWLAERAKNVPTEVDLRNADQQKLLVRLADDVYEKIDDIPDIEALDREIAKEATPAVFTRTALKLVKSKSIVASISSPLMVSVVFAMYKEQDRIRSVDEHPHGEDFLRRKIEQLQWLCSENPNVQWELIPVDDGCPNNSGLIAKEIVEKEKMSQDVKVCFLKNAIDEGLPPVINLVSTSDSQKGASIVYGMWYAVTNSAHENHIIIYTDADLSTHLGQIGLLIDPILNNNKLASIGSRREKDSVVVKKGTRNIRGKLFIYLWKRLLPALHYIIDTQCGFKAFKKQVILELINDMIESKFAFDIELLLKTELMSTNSIAKIGVAWIDSEEASTTTDLQPYLPMLKKIVAMYRAYVPTDPISEEFAQFIDGLQEDNFRILLEHIPSGIVEREPYLYHEYNRVSAQDLYDVLQ